MQAQAFYGIYRGVCLNVHDPRSSGRISVRVPAVPGAAARWALPCAAVLGPGARTAASPPVGASIWVMFEGGDPERPVWMGWLWAGG
jgi:hypothetical protein